MSQFLPFSPPPGYFNDGTEYSSRGLWNSGDKVRFRGGFPEKIGGWEPVSLSRFDGVARLILQWSDLDNNSQVGLFTSSKVYVQPVGSGLTDRTPLRPAPLGANPLSTTNSSPDLVVSHRAHGLIAGDVVWLRGASAVGGFTAASINKPIAIHSVVNADSYILRPGGNASSTGTGGGLTVLASFSKPSSVPLANNPISVEEGSDIATVTHANNGSSVGDFVVLSGLSSVGGSTINGEYSIVSVLDANSYTIRLSSAATSTATGGGAAGLAKYYYSSGIVELGLPSGWGAGPWGAGPWGFGDPSASGPETPVQRQVRLWSAATFGEDLVANPRGGPIFFCDVSGVGNAIDINLLPGASFCPKSANYIISTPEDRRIVAFGCDDPFTGEFDPKLIRWCSSENLADWDPTDDEGGTAGFLRLSSGSEIICAARARGEILVWTESTLSALRFADELIFGATLLSPNIDIISPNSVVSIDDAVFWMGRKNFFTYNGRAMVMPCSVREYVFGDINVNQSYKVFACTNTQYREVTWHYPSASSSEPDRYVSFNYAENVWYFGTMSRTAWSDAGFTKYPIAAGTDGYLYYHEYGLDDGTVGSAGPMAAFIESGPVELGEGDRFGFVTSFIPDVTFSRSTSPSPNVRMTIVGSRYPGSDDYSTDPSQISSITKSPIETWTRKVDVRIRARQMKVRIESLMSGVFFRLGRHRIKIRPDGRK